MYIKLHKDCPVISIVMIQLNREINITKHKYIIVLTLFGSVASERALLVWRMRKTYIQLTPKCVCVCVYVCIRMLLIYLHHYVD